MMVSGLLSTIQGLSPKRLNNVSVPVTSTKSNFSVRPLKTSDQILFVHSPKALPIDPRLKNSSSEFIRSGFAHIDRLGNLFSPLFAACGFSGVSQPSSRSVLQKVEAWRFLSGALGINIFDRAMKDKKYRGGSRAPGYVDVMQSVYLSGPPGFVFVTADPPQRQLFKRIAPLGHAKRYVYSYEEFRIRLLTC